LHSFVIYLVKQGEDLKYIQNFLFEAWKRVKANKGAPGYDKVTFSEIEKYGVVKYLQELAES